MPGNGGLQHASAIWGMHKRSPQIALNTTLGHNMRVYRASLGLSQEALAERSGIKRTYIGAVERGEVDPRLGTVSKIAEGLGVEPYRLLYPRTVSLPPD